MAQHVQFVDYPPTGMDRGWYVVDHDYDEYVEGPFLTAEAADRWLYETDQSPDPMADVEFPFAKNH